MPRAPSPAEPLNPGAKPIEEDNTVDELANAFTHLPPIHGDLSLTKEDVETAKPPSIETQTNVTAANKPIDASAPVIIPSAPIAPTIVPISIPAVPMATPGNPSTGGKLSGNAPTIFDGNQGQSKKFICEFDLY
ncbi:hypothetical protein EDB89DRAFT_2078553 [Lactarius sanguifluus]|nr:hypothetical protein EDB89DRAFT_2078553 [Lactarius sanguifluus]